jgi:pyruvate dehydrogenase E2 component (dihydrolipoyllysine-residue acetyltransferase)
MAEVTMPRLSDTMEEGTIAAWLKKPGEQVSKGEVLAQIETDKATMDLTAFEAGTLTEILAPEGTTVAIGKPVARIGSGSGSRAGKSTEAPAPPAAEASGSETPKTPEARENVAVAPEPQTPPSQEPTTREASTPPERQPTAPEPEVPKAGTLSNGTNGKVRASPMARHIAAEHGLDLSDIQGSGPQGRVIRADVEAALGSGKQGPTQAEAEPQRAAAPSIEGEGDERVNLSQMRRTIARRMAESTRTIPHFYLTTSVDATDLGALRKQINAQTADAGIKVTFNDLIVKGAALAIRQVPEVNVSFAEDSLIRHSRVHVGIAVATDRGLIVPVLRDVDTISVGAIARQTRDLAERANAGKLQPNEYSGGTFTVSNLGMFGVEQFQAVINPPESAILAVGAITREPAEYQGEIALRDRLRLTLSVDHRALDGAIGARYLQALKALLEKPMLLLV